MNIVDRLNHHLFKDTVLNYFQCSFLLGRLYYSIVPSSEMSGSVCLYVYAPLARPFKIKI